MIEDSVIQIILQGGALGILGVSTLYNQIYMRKSIDNNSLALGSFLESSKKCQK